MLFWITVDGYRVAVQAVNRNGKPYYRLAPYTIIYPTPRQREVRNRLSVAAHRAQGGTYVDIDDEVRAGFTDWEYTDSRKPNTTYLALKSIYGDEVDSVLTYISGQKYVAEKLKLPEYQQRIRKQIQEEAITVTS